ncbi:MAG: hypothetical protein ACREQ4_06430 [Candidatus Binataceae bacterium]
MLIALADGSLAKYPPGGGHWSWFLQYPLGLRALGHRVFWFELLPASGDEALDRNRIRTFFARAAQYGFERDCALFVFEPDVPQSLERGDAYGMSIRAIREQIHSTDLLWNFCCALREPLLSAFRRRVLIDVDPGHLQVCGLHEDMGIHSHQAFLTVGAKIHQEDCEIPTLGLKWHAFNPFVYMPAWPLMPDSGVQAPFTSVTQWTWEELPFNGRTLSASKRAAYLNYARLPQLAKRPFELAANIGSDDVAGDRATLASYGWRLSEPHRVAGTPEDYRRFIVRSRAEILCPKPVFRELRTGWFSDRSVGYLASGRPVLAGETGFSQRLPVGRGILSFSTIEEAVAGVTAIDSDYAVHRRAARDLAETYFDSRKCLPAMLSASS